MIQVAECVGATVGAFGLMWVLQWRHYVRNGKYARKD